MNQIGRAGARRAAIHLDRWGHLHGAPKLLDRQFEPRPRPETLVMPQGARRRVAVRCIGRHQRVQPRRRSRLDGAWRSPSSQLAYPEVEVAEGRAASASLPDFLVGDVTEGIFQAGVSEDASPGRASG